jgi:hypothetical protein
LNVMCGAQLLLPLFVRELPVRPVHRVEHSIRLNSSSSWREANASGASP